MNPRGIRLNNPGNIRRTATMWQGESNIQADPDFVTFLNPIWGIRAIVRILYTYSREGITTLSGVINRWAPTVENNTDAYLADVCSRCSKTADASINWPTDVISIVKAIIQHENGIQPYDDDTFNRAVALAERE